jgi:predicted nucleotide-binding protein (sugar kinase/HSP70/actin superfamily)
MKVTVSGQPQPTTTPLMLKSRREIEEEIARRVAAERQRLQQRAGMQPEVRHFQRPVERAFTAAERDQVTILIGGLTWKHEWLIKSVFEAAGYRTAIMPVPDVPAFQLGKEFGNNGQCNPTYFMTGHLIQYLQNLEKQGMTRSEIIDKYVFFTAGSCGPCRFGMYEAEYRLAVQNAGFDGFRILLFQQSDGIKAASGEPGLKFTVDFGLGALDALNLGDIMNDIAYQLRPFEVNEGQTDRVFKEVMTELSDAFRNRTPFEIMKRAPAWATRRLETRNTLRGTLNTLGKLGDRWYGQQTRDALAAAEAKLAAVEVDRLRVKPVVKITGEFFAQTTEGDGNFKMFQFLEREGAQVMVEPVGNWIMYLLWQAREKYLEKRRVEGPKLAWWALGRLLKDQLQLRGKLASYATGRAIYNAQYNRMIRGLGGLAHPLTDQFELARVAQPYYHRLARGGEGHLEVGKNIYYTVHKKAHMVLSLKPFGCMPSSQSDGVQSAVMNHFKDMIFLPIETSGEGEINAHSRVQMALGEAKAKAKTEFQQMLESTGKRLEDVRGFVADHPELRHPFYHVPHRKGVTGTAANFVLHVSDLMDRRRRFFPLGRHRRTPVAAPAPSTTTQSAEAR